MPLLSWALGVGGGCCLSAPLLAQLFTISSCRSLFSGLFSACASSPRIAPVLGERDRCGHQGKSPADLMAATDFETRPAFFKAGKSIFLSLILFGEDVRLHYL
ncbi:hypothetical protein B5K05_06665 [Rhizobium phaseoli]|nr:hypothetical protein B5K04_06635 [Rhizobium phaseoli]RDJ17874.1 hypothetical protein B5K05_06665 [Rhizobium phaseoli]